MKHEATTEVSEDMNRRNEEAIMRSIHERYWMTEEERACLPEGVRLCRFVAHSECEHCILACEDHTCGWRFPTKVCLKDLYTELAQGLRKKERTKISSGGGRMSDQVKYVEHSQIKPNPWQPRQDLVPTEDFIASVKNNGLEQLPTGRERDGYVELAAGGLRWETFKILDQRYPGEG